MMFRWMRVLGGAVGAVLAFALLSGAPAAAAPSAAVGVSGGSVTSTGVVSAPVYLATSYYVRVRATFPASLQLGAVSQLKVTYDPGVTCSVSSVERYASPTYIKAITWTCTRAGTTAKVAGFTVAFRNVTYRFSTTFRPVNLGLSTMFKVINSGGARWQPCYRTLKVALNMNGLSAAERALVVQAFDEIKATTGIGYTIVGTTTMIPNRSNFGQTVKGVDIVFAFARPGQSNLFTAANPGVIGQGGASWFLNHNSSKSWNEYRDGKVVISTAVLAQSAPTRKLVYMHELGHVMGLDHVSSLGTQVMEPVMRNDRPAVWGLGDRAGLAKLGLKSGCLPFAWQ